ncbi:hypothetical protein P3635_01680 [Vibrio parahaemolyticus]|nr:hypothetical protein [Vibrio parahaemolyticus]MDG2700685.1 hypothetical protein [Vibrio parahaemolyticus]HCG6969613.1 hypothetical protein [Vibrio parahaemolyticus]
MAKKQRVVRQQKRVIQFVGEGQTERAFLRHIRSIYGSASPDVKASTANGKGPSNVLGVAIGKYRNSAANVEVAALLDKDLKWPATKVREAKQLGIKLIGVDPCVEGMMLDILDLKRPNPCTNDSCKKKMHPLINNAPTVKESYQERFTKAVLDAARDKVDELDEIIKIYEG